MVEITVHSQSVKCARCGIVDFLNGLKRIDGKFYCQSCQKKLHIGIKCSN
jgi:transposase